MHDDHRVTAETTSALTRRILAPNAGPMTLDGTNSYLIAAPDAGSVVVVDPGPLDDAHLAALAATPVVLVLLTHRHHDHSESRGRFAELTGAPVRAFDPAYCVDGSPLRADEMIEAAGTRIRVVHTPGHTSDSVSFHLPDDGPTGSMLTGDTILGRGTTILDFPDGTLGDYLGSLNTLRAFGPATVLPAHGPVLPDLSAVSDAYRRHREERLEQIRAALAQLGPDASVEAVTDLVYVDAPAGVRFAAEASVPRNSPTCGPEACRAIAFRASDSAAAATLVRRPIARGCAAPRRPDTLNRKGGCLAARRSDAYPARCGTAHFLQRPRRHHRAAGVLRHGRAAHHGDDHARRCGGSSCRRQRHLVVQRSARRDRVGHARAAESHLRAA